MRTIKSVLTELKRLEGRSPGHEIRILLEGEPQPDEQPQAGEVYRPWIILDGRPDKAQ